MYARSTTIQGNPQALDVGIAYVRDEVLPALQQMEGCIGLSMLADRDSGRCIVTGAWADEAAMRASAESARPLRDRAAGIFGGQPEVAEWEIALLHRKHQAGDGARTRVIWAQGEPGQADRDFDAVGMSLVPKMDELPGFCSISLLVDRQNGRSVTAVAYESREAMERANEQASAMRAEFIKAIGMEITEMAEFDLVLAHLRVPETV